MKLGMAHHGNRPPALKPGRKCWLEPIGIVTIVRPPAEDRDGIVLNKWGQELNVNEFELRPLGVQA